MGQLFLSRCNFSFPHSAHTGSVHGKTESFSLGHKSFGLPAVDSRVAEGSVGQIYFKV